MNEPHTVTNDTNNPPSASDAFTDDPSPSSADDRRSTIVDLVRETMRLPYVWPSPPTAAFARRVGKGSCASKHALLSERLEQLGVTSRPMFVLGPLVPAVLARDPQLRPGLDLYEVHECLTVSVPAVGPLRVDVTWDPPLVRRGLPGTLDWDGRSDMTVAVGDSGDWWMPDPARLREEKEELRSRMYSPGQRAIRDSVLEAMASRFEQWRSAAREDDDSHVEH